MYANSSFLLKRLSVATVFLWFLSASTSFAQSPDALLPSPKPADVSPRLKNIVGEYGSDELSYTVFELDGTLWMARKSSDPKLLKETSPGSFWADLAPNEHVRLDLTTRELTHFNFD